MVILLLAQGADSSAQDSSGYDALAAAKHADKKSPEIIDLLTKDKKAKRRKSIAIEGRGGGGRRGSFAAVRSRKASASDATTGDAVPQISKKKRWFGGI